MRWRRHASPYYDKTDTEIERLFSVQVSPDTRALVLGEVVAKCWRMEYKDIGKSMADISHIQLEGKCANTVRNKGETGRVRGKLFIWCPIYPQLINIAAISLHLLVSSTLPPC